MRGFGERMEWLQRFQDKPVTYEQVIELLMETDDDD
jgi:lipoate-protein ligase A